MKLLFDILLYGFLGSIVWRAVLGRSAYSDTVKPVLRWLHAILLFYVLINAVSTLNGVVWLLHNYMDVIACFNSKPSLIGSPLIGAAMVIGSLSGTALLWVCSEMIKRKRNVLGWYFVLWPINFLCYTYIAMDSIVGKYSVFTVFLAGSMWFGLFAISIVFYLNKTIVEIFFENSVRDKRIRQ
jgi:hypothetical protein